MAIISALVGAVPAMFAWHPIVATMVATGGATGSFFLVQRILQKEILLGNQVQNVLAQLTLQKVGRGKYTIK